MASLIELPAATPPLPANPPYEEICNTSTASSHSQSQTIPDDHQNGNQDDAKPLRTLNIPPMKTPKDIPRMSSLFSWAINQESAFRSAIDKADYVKAKRSLDNGVDIKGEHFKDHHKLPETALFRCARIWDLPSLRWILDQGLHPDACLPYVRGTWNTGSLLTRVLSKRLPDHLCLTSAVAQILLDYGADINGIGFDGHKCVHSALYTAVVNRKHEVVIWLLERKPNIRQLESRQWDAYEKYDKNVHADQDTVFHAAARCGDLKMLELLLDKMGDVDILNSLKQSALHVAVQYCMTAGSIASSMPIDWLLDHGACIDLLDIHRKPPLFYCLAKPWTFHVAKGLIKRGADLNRIKILTGMSPSRYAFTLSNDELGFFLLGYEPDLTEVDVLGNTLLHVAAMGGCLKSYKCLVAIGMEREAKNRRGDSALMAAEVLLKYNGHGGYVRFESERDREDLVRRLGEFVDSAKVSAEWVMGVNWNGDRVVLAKPQVARNPN